MSMAVDKAVGVDHGQYVKVKTLQIPHHSGVLLLITFD